MSTFVAKLRTLTLGTVHDLLDREIDLNSPSVVRQNVRDLEDALDKMRLSAAEQAGALRTATRETTELEEKINTGRATITKLQQTGHPDLARIRAAEVLTQQSIVKQKKADMVTMQQSVADIDVAVNKLDVKHAQMVARLRQLESVDRDTKAKERAASTLRDANRLTDSFASVDSVQERMQARNDVAQEKFKRALGESALQDDPEQTAAIDQLLEETKPQEEKSQAASS